MAVTEAPDKTFDLHIPVVVVGAGACGLTAAIAARDGGVEVLVIERDSTPLGTTGMSTGLIPAAGTAEQSLEGEARVAMTPAPRLRKPLSAFRSSRP